MIQRPCHICVLAILVALTTTSQALAQQNGKLSGLARDQTGAGLADVTLTLSGPTTADARSNAAGAFEFRDLRPGTYALQASLAGFDTTSRMVEVEPGQTLSLVLILSLLGIE